VKKVKETGDAPPAGSVAERCDSWIDDLRSGQSRRLKTPWPDLDCLVGLEERRRVGLVAQRGTREATVGRRIAIHVAETQGHVLLCTSFPPDPLPERLHVEPEMMLTPEHVNAAVRRLIRAGTRPVLIVIERYERLRLDERPEGDRRYDEIERCAHEIRSSPNGVDVPCLYTTTTDREPDLSRRILDWAGVNSPGGIMTDFCRTLLVLRRLDRQQVEVRIELDRVTYRHPEILAIDLPS
jgi:hypothetical protein